MNRIVSSIILLAAGASANAYEFRARFVERVGNIDVVIDSGLLVVDNFTPRRVRIQFGVFDDAAGAAPAGGFVGWNIGTIDVTSGPDTPVTTRTPGRLSPFNFSTLPSANGNPPLPSGDPFTSLTDIDVTLGTQSPPWLCDASGNPLPQPQAIIRGLNTYISVYEMTTSGFPVGAEYFITVSGHLIAATEWRHVGFTIPPDCGDPADPMDDVPGNITYGPYPTEPAAFSTTLRVEVIPAPAAGVLLIAMGMLSGGRRRR